MKRSCKIAHVRRIDEFLHAGFLIVLAFTLSVLWQVHGLTPGFYAGLGLFLTLLGGVIMLRSGEEAVRRELAMPARVVGPLLPSRTVLPEPIHEKPAQELRVPCLSLPGHEVPSAAARSSTGDIAVREVMLTDFQTLSPDDTLSEAAHLLIGGSQEDFPVVDYSCLVGVLTRDRLFEALRSEGESALVRDTMDRDFETAQPSDRLDEVLARTESSPAALPVISGGRLIGMLTEQNISERLMIRAALTSRRRTARPNPPPTPENWITTSDADLRRRQLVGA
jgi:CBS domain-containing protein